jgi:GST-like protein
LFVATGVGPYSGQAVHFKTHALEKIPYAINRYDFEAERHYGILDKHLTKSPYMLGEVYTIVDMAVWGWARLISRVVNENALSKMPGLKRLIDEITARPAAERAVALTSQHQFKAEMDDDARRNMFPQNARIAG